MSRNKPTVRDVALVVAASLRESGHVAYFAGGCVRDRLLGLEPTDYDVATDARPEQVLELFPKARRVGEAFGVVLVSIRGRHVEVATFRTDGVYADGRHPESVTYSDEEHDARRRDFTINGLFEDPTTGEVIDHVGGRVDLDAGIVRAIGDPTARFAEDRLRMLRAARFASRFGFDLDAATAKAIRRFAGDLAGVSRERIGHEIRAMLSRETRAEAARLIQDLGLDAAVFDEPAARVATPRLGGLAYDADFSTALAAWAIDRGSGQPAGAGCSGWARALVLSKEERRQLAECLEAERRLRSGWADLPVARQKRFAVTEGFRRGLMVLRSVDPAAAQLIDRRVERLAADGLAPEPLVVGQDLIELGLVPGPSFRLVLDEVYDAQLEGRLDGKTAALDLARAVAGRGGGGLGGG